MRLSPFPKILVGLATLFPFLALLLPLVFMAFLSLGLWDPVGDFLLARVPSVTLESIAWNVALALGSLLLVLHLALVAFYIWHLIKNKSAPRNVRIGFALALLIVPFIAMTAYYFAYVLPANPPIGAGPPSRGHA